MVLFVVFVTGEPHGGAAEAGLLRGVQAVGGLLGGALVGRPARVLPPARLLGWSPVGFGVVTAVGWNDPHLTTALLFYLAAFAVVGAPGVVAGAAMMSVLQLHAADEVRGRVPATFFGIHDACQAVGMGAAGALTPVPGPAALLNARAGLLLVAGAPALTVPHRAAGAGTARPAPAPLPPDRHIPVGPRPGP